MKCDACEKELISTLDTYGFPGNLCRDCWYQEFDFVAEQIAFNKMMQEIFVEVLKAEERHLTQRPPDGLPHATKSDDPEK
jgi:hypothetical protein